MFYEGFDYGYDGPFHTSPLGTLWPYPYGRLTTTWVHQSNGFPVGGGSYFGEGIAKTPLFGTGHRWVHAAVKLVAGNHARIVALLNGGYGACTIAWDGFSGQVHIYRGGYWETIIATSLRTLSPGDHLFWIYADLKQVGGYVYVFVDKETTPFVKAPNMNVSAVATPDFDQINLMGEVGASFYLDDLVVLTESEKQTVLGIGATVIDPVADPTNVPAQDLFAPSYVPSADVSVQWTPLAGANYQNVDSNPISTAEYNSTSSLEQRDLLAYPGLGFTPTRAAVVKVSTYAAVDGVITGVANAISSGGAEASDALGQSRGSAGVYALRETFYATRPGGAAWDVASVHGLQFGYISRNA